MLKHRILQVIHSNYWKINWAHTPYGYSVNESGSSGAPLINSDHRVIGQLRGTGSQSCTAPEPRRCISELMPIQTKQQHDGKVVYAQNVLVQR